MFDLLTWGNALIGYIEEIILAGAALLTGAGVLIVKGQKIKNEFIELIDSSETDNKEFEKSAVDKGLKIAAKLIQLIPRKG